MRSPNVDLREVTRSRNALPHLPITGSIVRSVEGHVHKPDKTRASMGKRFEVNAAGSAKKSHRSVFRYEQTTRSEKFFDNRNRATTKSFVKLFRWLLRIELFCYLRRSNIQLCVRHLFQLR